MITFTQWLVENHAPEDYSLEHKFAHYNQLLFNDKIPPTPVSWVFMRGAGGHTLYRPTGRTILPGSMRIELSTAFKKNEQQLDSILIHEMIHAFLAFSQGDGDIHHGRQFKMWAMACSHKSGIEIKRTDDITNYELTDEHKELSTVLIMKRPDLSLFTVYRGAPFDDVHQQNALEGFWGVPGRMPEGSELRIIKAVTGLGEKYGFSEGLIQKKWKEMNASELENLLQIGHVIRTIMAGSVSHETSIMHLPSKQALALIQHNIGRDTDYVTFYAPSLAKDPVALAKITGKYDKYHTPGRTSIELLSVNSPMVTQGAYKLFRDPEKGSYYTLTPDKVAALRQGATTLRSWV